MSWPVSGGSLEAGTSRADLSAVVQPLQNEFKEVTLQCGFMRMFLCVSGSVRAVQLSPRVKNEATDLNSSVATETRNMALPPPSNDVIDRVRADAGVGENRIQEAVKNLKEWLKLQPHLPHDYGKSFRCRQITKTIACSIMSYSCSVLESSVFELRLTSGNRKADFFNAFRWVLCYYLQIH